MILHLGWQAEIILKILFPCCIVFRRKNGNMYKHNLEPTSIYVLSIFTHHSLYTKGNVLFNYDRNIIQFNKKTFAPIVFLCLCNKIPNDEENILFLINYKFFSVAFSTLKDNQYLWKKLLFIMKLRFGWKFGMKHRFCVHFFLNVRKTNETNTINSVNKIQKRNFFFST